MQNEWLQINEKKIEAMKYHLRKRGRKMQNEWLQINEKKIKDMQYQLTEFAYKREAPGVPFESYRGMIGAAVVEIKKQQEKINELQAKADELEKIKKTAIDTFIPPVDKK